MSTTMFTGNKCSCVDSKYRNTIISTTSKYTSSLNMFHDITNNGIDSGSIISRKNGGLIDHGNWRRFPSLMQFVISTFAEGTETFLVHKYMLVSRSPVFETMFYGSFEHAPGKAINIPDVSPRAFRLLLE